MAIMPSQKQESRAITRAIIKIVSILVLFFIITSVILTRYIPGDTIMKVIGEADLFNNILCTYYVRIDSKSMKPRFTVGKVVKFNKCIEDKTVLEESTIVLYKDGPSSVIGVIRKIVYVGDEMLYQISCDEKPEDVTDVRPDDIIGAYEPN
ncbi:MAG: hypothetical protein U9Q67_04020 [Patescibacteria group bacterium]|nr:hypothetical protein [Patescibacteria group bacterium]